MENKRELIDNKKKKWSLPTVKSIKIFNTKGGPQPTNFEDVTYLNESPTSP